MAEKPKLPVRRKLAPIQARPTETQVVQWTDDAGTDVSLSLADVKELFRGKYPLTDREWLLFLHQCRSKRANPFQGDLYPIKYAADGAVALVTGYHHLMRQAKRSPDYAGFSQWFVNADGKRIPDGLETLENVLAAVCEVYVRGYQEAVRFTARLKEFRKQRPGADNPWNAMPIIMLGKCAIAGAHRLADPGIGRMYLEEEVGQPYVEGEVVNAAPAEVAPPDPSEAARPLPEAAPAPESPANGLSEARRGLLRQFADAAEVAGLDRAAALKHGGDRQQRDVTKLSELTDDDLRACITDFGAMKRAQAAREREPGEGDEAPDG
jgi:phage recombination protein Bet